VLVINLLKDVQRENPDIYLTLKSKLRALGLYNEDFSIQSMIYREHAYLEDGRPELMKYKQLEKLDLIKVL
jgi:hypothetical protein